MHVVMTVIAERDLVVGTIGSLLGPLAQVMIVQVLRTTADNAATVAADNECTHLFSGSLPHGGDLIAGSGSRLPVGQRPQIERYTLEAAPNLMVRQRCKTCESGIEINVRLQAVPQRTESRLPRLS